jgi:hypothetical protein
MVPARDGVFESDLPDENERAILYIGQGDRFDDDRRLVREPLFPIMRLGWAGSLRALRLRRGPRRLAPDREPNREDRRAEE